MVNFTMVKYFCAEKGTYEYRRVILGKKNAKRYLKLDEATELLVKIRIQHYIKKEEQHEY